MTQPATKSHDPVGKHFWGLILQHIVGEMVAERIPMHVNSDTMQITMRLDASGPVPLQRITCTWYAPDGCCGVQKETLFNSQTGERHEVR